MAITLLLFFHPIEVPFSTYGFTLSYFRAVFHLRTLLDHSHHLMRFRFIVIWVALLIFRRFVSRVTCDVTLFDPPRNPNSIKGVFLNLPSSIFSLFYTFGLLPVVRVPCVRPLEPPLIGEANKERSLFNVSQSHPAL